MKAAKREEDDRSESAYIGEGVKRRRTEGPHKNVYFLEKVMKAASFSPSATRMIDMMRESAKVRLSPQREISCDG